MTKVFKDPRAIKLCDDIRFLYSFSKRDGWVVRPRHGEKKIVVGHPDYCSDLDISTQVDALISSLETLGLAREFGYTIHNLADDNPDDSNLCLPLFGAAGSAVP
jgi:hypothetical protein